MERVKRIHKKRGRKKGEVSNAPLVNGRQNGLFAKGNNISGKLIQRTGAPNNKLINSLRFQGRFISMEFMHMLTQERDKWGRSRLARMARAVAERAANGDLVAAQFITDRIEGKSVQAVQHSGRVEHEGKQLVVHMSLDEMANAYADTLKQIKYDKDEKE